METIKVYFDGKIYQSIGDLANEKGKDGKFITDASTAVKYDKKVEELKLKGGNYIIHIDLFGKILKVITE